MLDQCQRALELLGTTADGDDDDNDEEEKEVRDGGEAVDEAGARRRLCVLTAKLTSYKPVQDASEVPEDKAEKKRLLKRAQAENGGKIVEAKKPIVVKYGLNHVTYLIEQANFNDKYEEYWKKWGGGIMGSKSQAKTKAKERLLAKEAA